MSEGQAGQLATSGWAFYLAGNRQGALRDFRAALAVDPDHVNALTGLAQTHMALNQLPAAGEVAKHLLKIAPDLAQAHRIQGEVLRRRRRLGDAEEHVRKAIKLDPDEPIGYHYLAVIQFEQKQYRSALATVEEGRKLAPWYAVLAAQKALILLHFKGPKAAEPFADEALRLRGDDNYVLINVARVMLMRGKLERRTTCSRRCCGATPMTRKRSRSTCCRIRSATGCCGSGCRCRSGARRTACSAGSSGSR